MCHTNENLSVELLAHISKEFGARMTLDEIISIVSLKCKNSKLYDEIKLMSLKYKTTQNYFSKVHKTLKSIDKDSNINKNGVITKNENELNKLLIKQISTNIFTEILKCKVISNKMKLEVQLLLRKKDNNFNFNNIKNLLEKIFNFYNELEKSRENYKRDHDQIVPLNKYEFILKNRIIVNKIAVNIADYLKHNVDN